MTFLNKIINHKIKELVATRQKVSLDSLKIRVKSLPKTRDFKQAIIKNSGIIAEIKRASPSKGALRLNLNAVKLAKSYEKNGAAAISVLTEKQFFKGSSDDLTKVKKAIKLPVLRKDFIIDPYQVYESRVIGADAILLIASILSVKKLRELYKLASQLGLYSLVEVHDKKDLKKALSIPRFSRGLIGINNRNLKTFKTDLATSLSLVNLIPDNYTVIAESGIKASQDIFKLKIAGINGFLIGETLVKAKQPGVKLKELTRTQIKICGITNLQDAQAAVKYGADMLGFIFAPSPRRITPAQAKKIIDKLPESIIKVGVFVNEPLGKVKRIMKQCNLDLVQLHGDESPRYVKSFKGKAFKVFRAEPSSATIKGGKSRSTAALYKIKKYGLPLFLLDTYVPGKAGGTGKTFDLKIAREAGSLGNVILAGGLTPDNVVRAIKKVKPAAVDVVSGVEKSPGKKNYKKLKKFITRVKNAQKQF